MVRGLHCGAVDRREQPLLAHRGRVRERDGSPSVWLGHDVGAYFKTAGEKRVLLTLIQGGDLGGGAVRIRICFDPSKAIVADTWEDDPACLDLVRAIGHGACEGPIQCVSMPALTNGCIPIAGGSICAGNLRLSPVAGISSLCRRITVSADCSGFYQGQMDCWTDLQGCCAVPTTTAG